MSKAFEKRTLNGRSPVSILYVSFRANVLPLVSFIFETTPNSDFSDQQNIKFVTIVTRVDIQMIVFLFHSKSLMLFLVEFLVESTFVPLK